MVVYRRPSHNRAAGGAPNFRRDGEHTGRLTERLLASEKANEFQRQMLDATCRHPPDCDDFPQRLREGNSKQQAYVCSPVVKYSRQIQGRVALEIVKLTEDSVATGMPSYYAARRWPVPAIKK